MTMRQRIADLLRLIAWWLAPPRPAPAITLKTPTIHVSVPAGVDVSALSKLLGRHLAEELDRERARAGVR